MSTSKHVNTNWLAIGSLVVAVAATACVGDDPTVDTGPQLDASTDSAVADSAAGDASAGAGFCGSQSVQAFVCSDFDEGQSDPAVGWSGVDLVGGGVAKIEETNVVSKPAALAFNMPASTSPVDTALFLAPVPSSKPFDAALRFEVSINAACIAAGSKDYEGNGITVARFDFTSAGGSVVYRIDAVVASGSTAQKATLSLETLLPNEDGGLDFKLSTDENDAITLDGSFFAVEIEIHSGAGQPTAKIQGSAAPLPTASITGQPRFSVGVISAALPAACEVDFDNVILSEL